MHNRDYVSYSIYEYHRRRKLNKGLMDFNLHLTTKIIQNCSVTNSGTNNLNPAPFIQLHARGFALHCFSCFQWLRQSLISSQKNIILTLVQLCYGLNVCMFADFQVLIHHLHCRLETKSMSKILAKKSAYDNVCMHP